jgi:hypothetical protein
MDADLLPDLIKEGVSLAILLVVLFGIYRLTDTMIKIVHQKLDECCDILEGIQDAIRDIDNKRDD